MHSSTSREDVSSKHYPKMPHSAIICGQTGCGKTELVLDLLESHYRGYFENIVFICPTWRHNSTYVAGRRPWLFNDSEVYLIDPCDSSGENRLHDWLKLCHKTFENEETLYVIDDCASSKVLSKKGDELTNLAYSGRHTKQSVWIITQKYKSVLKDFRTQTKWTALFFCKDRDSFDECLQENDVIPVLELRDELKKTLASTKHSALIMITEQPTSYYVHMP